jgi:hypothetical protein
MAALDSPSGNLKIPNGREKKNGRRTFQSNNQWSHTVARLLVSTTGYRQSFPFNSIPSLWL